MNKSIEEFKKVAHLYVGVTMVCTNTACHSDNEYFGQKQVLTPLLLADGSLFNGNWEPELVKIGDMTEEQLIAHLNMAYESVFDNLPVIDKTELFQQDDKSGIACKEKKHNDRIAFSIEKHKLVFSVDTQPLITNQFNHTRLLLEQFVDIFSIF